MSPEYYAGRPAMHKSVILCLAVYLRVSCPERGIGWARRKLCTLRLYNFEGAVSAVRG